LEGSEPKTREILGKGILTQRLTEVLHLLFSWYNPLTKRRVCKTFKVLWTG